jgi:hypothetical protein
MIVQLKTELRKLFTVRSTYFILVCVLAIVIFFGFYVSGWRMDKVDLLNPNTLTTIIAGTINTISLPGNYRYFALYS